MTMSKLRKPNRVVTLLPDRVYGPVPGLWVSINSRYWRFSFSVDLANRLPWIAGQTCIKVDWDPDNLTLTLTPIRRGFRILCRDGDRLYVVVQPMDKIKFHKEMFDGNYGRFEAKIKGAAVVVYVEDRF